MTKQELITELSLFNDIETKAEANRTLDLLKSIIIRELAAGNEVALGQDFGTFKPTTRSGLTPVTGAPYKSNLVKFSISAAFKRELNK